MNLPQQTITGLLDGSITRVFEVCDKPYRFDMFGNPHRAFFTDGVLTSHEIMENPFGEPGTIHTIGGQRFEVVESGVKQIKDIEDSFDDILGNRLLCPTSPLCTNPQPTRDSGGGIIEPAYMNCKCGGYSYAELWIADHNENHTDIKIDMDTWGFTAELRRKDENE